ncbi:hypothetical protein JYU34_002538 [Plutella xylostella]|uniref:Uncharacterized protein n=1 Tax=Plutella xylostella TaxID=51655 RepID=A0ABQ7R2H5_PLUXY|nr:hypothetical protein JYU34_002538 [Plutella xylostella]
MVVLVVLAAVGAAWAVEVAPAAETESPRDLLLDALETAAEPDLDNDSSFWRWWKPWKNWKWG